MSQSTTDKPKSKRWVPLEANPEVWNSYVKSLGVPEGLCEFHDVWSLEPDMLAFVPRPVYAVILLFPLTKDSNANPTDGLGSVMTKELPTELYYIKQTVGNACGAMAILHSLTNNMTKLPMSDEAFLKRFYTATKSMDPDEKAAYFEKDNEFDAVHAEAAQEGQTEAPSENDKVEPHYVAFIHQNGRLVELDGCKEGPIDHGETTTDRLLEDTAKVSQQVIAKAAGSLQFNIIALVGPQ